MAYDEALAERIRECVADVPGIAEIKMFGGLCFTVNGNMALGPVGEVCMVRVGPEAYAEALAGGVAEELDFTGRPMKGMVQVHNSDLSSDDALNQWVDAGIAYASSLPPKVKKTKK